MRSSRINDRGRVNDRGSTAIYLVVVTVGVIAAGGLALDGGRKLAALSEARAIAGNAARACAQAITLAGGDAGTISIDATAGADAAQAFSTSSTSVSSNVAGTHCSVTAVRTVNFNILPGTATVSATASAEAVLAP